jgi:transmembrane sensor
VTRSRGDVPAPLTLDEIARGWATKMGGAARPEVREKLESWLAASPEHRRAYARARGDYLEAAVLRTSKTYGKDRFDIRAFCQSYRWRLTGAAAAMALLLVAFGAGGSALRGSIPGGAMSAHAAEPLVTRRGEIRSFRLADGSTATLDTDSAAEVSISGGARHLLLSRGRARLEIVADRRPFRIMAGTAVVTAQRATVDVTLQEGGPIAVTLARGTADLRSGKAGKAGNAASQPLPLSVGELVHYRAGDPKPLRAAADETNGSADWTTGWAEHRTIRLDRLIIDANRYAEPLIILDDRRLGARTISGRFRIADSERFVSRIAALLDLEVERRADSIHLHRK